MSRFRLVNLSGLGDERVPFSDASLRGLPRPRLGPGGGLGVALSGYLRGRPLFLFSPVTGGAVWTFVSVDLRKSNRGCQAEKKKKKKKKTEVFHIVLILSENNHDEKVHPNKIQKKKKTERADEEINGNTRRQDKSSVRILFTFASTGRIDALTLGSSEFGESEVLRFLGGISLISNGLKGYAMRKSK